MARHAGVVLLAGPSGSGKSYVAHRTGLPVLCLDDFYKDGDDPTLPRSGGAVNWESPDAWDSAAAVRTIARLVRDGKAEVPVYAIGADRRVDARLLDLAGSPVFIAEGIFAAEIAPECDRLGLLAGAYALRRPRGVTFLRRLVRDLAERRKPPRVLLRRGFALLLAEPAVLRRQRALGCRPTGARKLIRRITALTGGHRPVRATADLPADGPPPGPTSGPPPTPGQRTGSGVERISRPPVDPAGR